MCILAIFSSVRGEYSLNMRVYRVDRDSTIKHDFNYGLISVRAVLVFNIHHYCFFGNWKIMEIV